MTADKNAVRGNRGGKIWRIAYPLVWVLIGTGAAGYIASSSAAPRIIAQLGADPTVARRQIAAAHDRLRKAEAATRIAQQRLAATTQQVKALTAKVAQLTETLRAERARALKPVASAGETQPPPEAKRVQTVAVAKPEARVLNARPAHANEVARATPAAPAAEPAQAGSTGLPAGRPDPNAPPMPSRTPKQRKAVFAAAPATVTTGSLQNRPAKAKAPAPTTAASAVERLAEQTAPQATAGANLAAIRLARAPTIGALRLTWMQLRKTHGSLLLGLRPQYRERDGGPAGPIYELVAGPVASRGEAIQTCAMLQVRSVSCGVDTFEGQPLPRI